MAQTFKYYLRLENNQLQWSTDQSNWSKVTPTSPSTTVDSDDEMEWETNDDNIQWIKVRFSGGNIIPNGNVNGNQSKQVRANVPNGIAKGLSDSYTITVKPSNGGAPGEFDPDIQTPPKG